MYIVHVAIKSNVYSSAVFKILKGSYILLAWRTFAIRNTDLFYDRYYVYLFFISISFSFERVQNNLLKIIDFINYGVELFLLFASK